MRALCHTLRQVVIPAVALALLLVVGPAPASGAGAARFHLEVVQRANERVLWSHPVQAGDRFFLDYRHSSDHTPVHDIFMVTAEGTFLLVEERFDWYGSGLEFHPSAHISQSAAGTRVHLQRPFVQIPLRVGEVAQHVLTVHQTRLPLLSIAEGRESVCIRITRQAAESR
ncbi:MAG: DUF1850 domain-containing protein [Desulfobacterales bacterium]|nr:DUF1850 domain-containing protein [Desulfobacterales bacterium]